MNLISEVDSTQAGDFPCCTSVTGFTSWLGESASDVCEMEMRRSETCRPNVEVVRCRRDSSQRLSCSLFIASQTRIWEIVSRPSRWT